MKNNEIRLSMAGMGCEDEYGNCLVPVVMQVRITKNDIDTIVSNFINGDSWGWCDSINMVGRLLGTNRDEQISMGGEIAMHDAEMDRWEALTKEKLIRGIRMYAENPVYGDIFEVVDHVLRIDCGQIDDEEADAIIQYALFAAVVYHVDFL